MPDRLIARSAALAGLLPALAWGAPESDAFEDPVLEEVVVEASRMRLTAGEMPVNTTVLSELDVRESAWQPADQILRQVPGVGFTFFTSRDVVRHPLVQRIIAAYESHDRGGGG